jgi:large subunit ribosomal protein L25
MDALELAAEVRNITGRHVKQLRRQGWVPAVLYGRDLDTVLLKINSREMTRVIREAGTHQLISLKIGNKKPQMTLARDIQRDVVKHNYLHVDFYAVKMDEKVTAHVPLTLIGEAPGVRDLAGILTQGLDELEIECLPGDLIASIEISVEGLVAFNDTISVSDLEIPDTITVLSDPDSMVAKIEPPRLVEAEEEELPEGAGAVSAEPEVLTEAREKTEEG